MSEQHANILKSMDALTRDLDSLGWDLPARLYYLVDDETDPTFRLVGQLPTHPCVDLEAGFDVGNRVPAEAHGIALAHETYRHLFFDELLERNPEMLDRIKQSAEREQHTEISEGESYARASAYYQEFMIPRLPAPSMLPENMRVEERFICTVLRNGDHLIHRQIRGTDKHAGRVEPKDALPGGKIPTSLYMFLNGIRPDADCEDPYMVVSDYLTLEALSALPVKED